VNTLFLHYKEQLTNAAERIFSEDHMQRTAKLGGKMGSFLMLKQYVYILITLLQNCNGTACSGLNG
jgi:hypothetical protein